MATAARARFAPHPQHRSLIAKVKIAQKDLGIAQDDYRQILFNLTGKMSAADCNAGQLVEVLKHFEARGWKPKVAAGKAVKSRPADNAMAKKARAMWISLHQLGAVRNPSEPALEAFAARQLGCERMQWADQSMGYKLIEALKAMGEKAGWDQDLSGIANQDRVHTLRVRLVEAIIGNLKRLGQMPRHWTVEDAAFQLCGVEPGLGSISWLSSELDAISANLGARLREAKGIRENQA